VAVEGGAGDAGAGGHRCGGEYARHYNGHRPHQGLQQETPLCQPGHAVDFTARTERRQVLGGLISEYGRAA
jgi:hypothetical protein